MCRGALNTPLFESLLLLGLGLHLMNVLLFFLSGGSAKIHGKGRHTCYHKVMVVRLVTCELTCGLSLDDQLQLDWFSIAKVVNLVSVVEILNGKWMLMTY